MKVIKATMGVLGVMLVAAVLVFGIARLGAGTAVSPPEKITADSPCPVAGCVSVDCHGAGPVPELADGETMTCPKVGCTAPECHAADRLMSHYRAPKNASLSLWILGLSGFTIAMVAVACYVK